MPPRLLQRALPLAALLAGSQQQRAPISRIPPAEFLFGFAQAEGSGMIPPKETVLTLDEMVRLRDELGINTIRVFVHPTLVGLPQRTWTGPEPIRYSGFPPSAYNWSALDALLGGVIAAELFPIVLPLVVDEYVNYLWADDLHRFDNATATPPRDYTNVSAVRELTAFTTAITGHLEQRFGRPFGVVFTELCGQANAGPAARPHEQQRWQSLVDAIRKSSAHAEVFGPEACSVLSWYAQLNHERAATCNRTFDRVWSGPQSPQYDSLERYAAVFDAPAYSMYSLAYLGAPDETPTKACNISELLAITDTVSQIVRPQCRKHGKRWLWSEHGWGSTENFFTGAPATVDAANNTALDLLHQNWASSFLGMDSSRGVLFWQAKDACDLPHACTGTGVLSTSGQPHATWAAWKALGLAMQREWRFLGSFHSELNAHRLPVASPADFVVLSPHGVVARLLSRTLAVYVDLPPGATGMRSLQLGSVHGRTLSCLLCDQSPGVESTVAIQRHGDTIMVSGLTPRRFYMFEVLQQETMKADDDDQAVFHG